MSRDRIPELEAISDRLIESVAVAIRKGRRVARKLPLRGRLLIDRPLPFLVAFRTEERGDDGVSHQLVTTEASFLVASSHRRLHARTAELVQAMVTALSERFGACLLIELWTAKQMPTTSEAERYVLQPRFNLYAGAGGAARVGGGDGNGIDLGNEPGETLETLAKSLAHVHLDRPAAVTQHAGDVQPAPLQPLLSDEVAQRLRCLRLGIEVEPVYRHWETGSIYPEALRELRRQVGRALKQTCCDFATRHTSMHPPHAQTLGTSRLDRPTRMCDARLTQVANAFEVLLDVTPTNEHSAWQAFEATRFEVEPEMHYRPLPIDPAVMKRDLHRMPIERVEDPTLAALFRERQVELDMQLNLMADRNTPRFVLESEQLYGRPDADLVELAETIISRLPAGDPLLGGEGDVSAEVFAERARDMVRQYRETSDHFRGSVQVRDDVSTLIVSHGCLLIDEHLVTHHARVNALVHHEVSTHLLTYFNGRGQRLRQLYTGFAGFEVLQEGLAVMIEYLVGGIDARRWRTLASRVVAVDRMLRGDSFVDTYHRLHEQCGLPGHLAFLTTMRAYRGGGLTKDLIYLRGLRDLLAHLGEGGELEPLYLGRFALHHLPSIQELRWRGIIDDGWLLPAPLKDSATADRLARLRQGVTVLDLVREVETAEKRDT